MADAVDEGGEGDSVPVGTYQEALGWLTEQGTSHVLLGNGFSIAWDPAKFRYDSLYEQADFSQASDSLIAAFEALGTHDFEKVMQALVDSARIADLYGASADTVNTMKEDADCLRELLADAIAASHPAGPFEVTPAQFVACRKFLEPFRHIYSVNYDLLL